MPENKCEKCGTENCKLWHGQEPFCPVCGLGLCTFMEEEGECRPSCKSNPVRAGLCHGHAPQGSGEKCLNCNDTKIVKNEEGRKFVCPVCDPKNIREQDSEERGWSEEFWDKYVPEVDELNPLNINRYLEMERFIRYQIAKAEQQALERGGAAVHDAVAEKMDSLNREITAKEMWAIVLSIHNSLKNNKD